MSLGQRALARGPRSPRSLVAEGGRALSSTCMGWRVVALALVLGCIGSSPSQASASTDPDLAAIGELAQEAQTRFETADYAGAIDLWTEAYAALPQESEYAQQRSVLVYQIAQACVEAYALDPQVLYLRKAERLYSAYQETIDPSDTETLAEVESTLVELREKIAAVEPEPSTQAPPAAETGERAPVEDRSIGDEGDGSPSTPVDPPAAAQEGRGLRITGAVLLGLGAASLGAMTYGLVWGARVDERGEAAMAAGESDVEVFRGLLSEGTTANRLAIGAGAAGAVAAVTGATLLGLGLRKRRARGGERDIAWAPLGLPRGAGIALGGRF